MPEKLFQKVLNYASEIDDKTMEQANELSKLPFVHPHVALMPDAHFGKGSSVGTVIPTKGAVIPAAVGVDIGCGVIGVETWLNSKDISDLNLAQLREIIERTIPLSPGNYNKDAQWAQHTEDRVLHLDRLAESGQINLSHSPKWREQLGSLGGGNHFIELCLDERDHVWLLLHSGSRGVGNKIAQKHIKIAQRMCKQWHIPLQDQDLAYLPQHVPEFSNYLKELNWAQQFAFENRAEMMDRFVTAVCQWAYVDDESGLEVERINNHHNYTTPVDIYGEKVWLTRKGAIDASEGKMGLIPGSMGTRSYVVEGKGSKAGLFSAPHGAGRRFSRTEARKRFTADDLADRMQGIEYRHGDEWVDEIPDAYKDVTQVIEDAKDLVEVKHTLRQILNVKGT